MKGNLVVDQKDGILKVMIVEPPLNTKDAVIDAAIMGFCFGMILVLVHILSGAKE